MAGIGPATSPLPRECSTTEPHGPRYKLLFANINQPNPMFGAGDEARTRDIQFGKLKLYQLSYTRIATYTNANRPFKTTSIQLLLKHWWRRLDSNQRTQRERIYSPSPLTTRPPLLTEPAIMLIF